MEILAYPTVGSFVANDYRTATVFQKYGIDFCCKGGRTIDEVCEHKKISSDTLLNELNEASKDTNKQLADFASWPLDLLVDYIEKRHHRFILETTPSLRQFLEKLCTVHGGRHPELFEIREEFNASADELALHMEKEEGILFPFVRKMVVAKNAHQKAEQQEFGTIQNPIQMMMYEHNVEGERFRKIATLSNNYTAPDDACTTYRVAFALLKEFEADLHLHIHLENNILFPNAITMETTFI